MTYSFPSIARLQGQPVQLRLISKLRQRERCLQKFTFSKLQLRPLREFYITLSWSLHEVIVQTIMENSKFSRNSLIFVHHSVDRPQNLLLLLLLFWTAIKTARIRANRSIILRNGMFLLDFVLSYFPTHPSVLFLLILLQKGGRRSKSCCCRCWSLRSRWSRRGLFQMSSIFQKDVVGADFRRWNFVEQLKSRQTRMNSTLVCLINTLPKAYYLRQLATLRVQLWFRRKNSYKSTSGSEVTR